jgi:hypothetical protein
MRIPMSIVIAAFASSAFASPKCTTEPREKWISEAAMRAKAEAAGHKVEVFKVTKGGCYEIYGRDAAGKRIEIYFNPMSGDVIQHS